LDQETQIACLQEEIKDLRKKCNSLAKNNRSWRRRCEQLRSDKRKLIAEQQDPQKKEAQPVRAGEECKMNYFISDLHFFCKSQTQEGSVNYDGRPFATVEEMHDYMLRRWNEKVTNGDTVYILGDVALRGRNDALIGLVAQLKGKKVLVRGNHDDLSDYRYKQLFHEICDYKELSENFDGQAYKLILSHYPILMWDGQHRGKILLYGHTHTSVEDAFFQDCIRRMNESEELNMRREGEKEIRAFNVGCMHPYMDYEPRTLKEILSAHEKREVKEE